MVKKCVYCSAPLGAEEVVDVCEKCGIGVWGQKMFQTIKDNCRSAEEAGSLHQGSVTQF